MPEFLDIPLVSVLEQFDQAVAKYGNNNAMIFYGKKITYKELKDYADRFATGLAALGVAKGGQVALLLFNYPQYVISLPGRAPGRGGGHPGQPGLHPSQEVRHQLIDSGAKVIVCQDILYDNIEKTGAVLEHAIITAIDESTCPAPKRSSRPS